MYAKSSIFKGFFLKNREFVPFPRESSVFVENQRFLKDFDGKTMHLKRFCEIHQNESKIIDFQGIFLPKSRICTISKKILSFCGESTLSKGFGWKNDTFEEIL